MEWVQVGSKILTIGIFIYICLCMYMRVCVRDYIWICIDDDVMCCTVVRCFPLLFSVSLMHPVSAQERIPTRSSWLIWEG